MPDCIVDNGYLSNLTLGVGRDFAANMTSNGKRVELFQRSSEQVSSDQNTLMPTQVYPRALAHVEGSIVDRANQKLSVINVNTIAGATYRTDKNKELCDEIGVDYGVYLYQRTSVG